MGINNTTCHNIDFKKPEDIYRYLEDTISLINYKLQSKQDDKELKGTISDVLDLVNKFRSNRLDKELEDLKKYQEWNNLTIAFYGETNAGKSTIIEALRLYFKEENKVKSQNEFKKINKLIEMKKNELTKIEERTKDIKSKIDSIKKKKNEDERELEISIENINTKKEKDIGILYAEYNDYEKNLQNKKIEEKEKTNISFWFKLLKFINFSNLNKEIRKLEEDLKIKKSFLDKTIIILEEESKNKIDKLNIDFEIKDNFSNEKLSFLISEENNNEQKTRDINPDFIELDKELKQYEDGVIISEKSDFTKKVTKYNFVHEDKKFTLLDVPGIEGDESEVIDEISNAIKKSHIIFYIHQAEKIPESGTLEKIKKHLSSSTEIYAISNRFINDLESLDIIDNIEDISNDINKEMKACLNDNYIKNNVISAQMMFLALADCLTIDSDFYLEQEFLFENISREELLEKLKFNDFLKFIFDEVIINEKYKIKKSNYNKLDKTLCELIDILNKASIENFEPLSSQIYNEVNEASTNLRNTMRKLKIDLELAVNKEVDIFKNSTRDYIYKQIEENINDDILKSKFEVIVEKNLEQLPKSIYTSIEKIREYNQNSIFEILKNFERRVKLLIES
jgi:glutaredoxin-related protein